MALTLFQESIPLSNKRVPYSASQNGAYTNPVIMSHAFDFTVCTNVLETVLYVRNDSANKYYRNVVVTLMKDDKNIGNPSYVFGTIKNDPSLGPIVDIHNGQFKVPATFSVEQPPAIPQNGYTITGSYMSNAIPILDYTDGTNKVATDDNISVKFSYGYDELSNVEWDAQASSLIIPYIGTINTPDISYIPIRMRILWKNASTLFTVRDYYIDISYEVEQTIGEVIS